VLAAAFTGLRWGELIALRRYDVDLAGRVLHVRRRLAQLNGGAIQSGPPKSAAGVRSVSLPVVLVDELRRHIEQFAGPGRVSIGPSGAYNPGDLSPRVSTLHTWAECLRNEPAATGEI
jgi:integrase